MRQRLHSDPLFKFSYIIFVIKFVLFELALLALSVYGLYRLVQDETGLGRPPNRVEISPPNVAAKSPPP